MKNILVLFFLMFYVGLKSQDITSIIYSDSATNNFGASRFLETDNDENFIFATYNYDSAWFFNELFTSPNNGFQVFKVAKDGGYLWSKNFAGERWVSIEELIVDERNNVYVFGFTWSDTLIIDDEEIVFYENGKSHSNSFIVKFNENGEIIKYKLFKNYSSRSEFRDCVFDSNGDIIVLGEFVGQLEVEDSIYLSNPVNGDTIIPTWPWEDTLITTSTNLNLFLLRMEQNLEVDTFVTIETYKGHSNESHNKLIIDEDDNLYGMIDVRDSILLGGETIRADDRFTDLVFVKWDRSFKKEWHIKNEGETGGYIPNQFEYIDGELYASGYRSGHKSLGGVSFPGSSGYYLLKLTKEGGVDWVKTFPHIADQIEGGLDGELFFAGYFNPPNSRTDLYRLNSNDGSVVDIKTLKPFAVNGVAGLAGMLYHNNELFMYGSFDRGLRFEDELLNGAEVYSQRVYFLSLNYDSIILSTDNSESESVNVYPSIIQDKVNVSSVCDKLLVYNSKGRQVLEKDNSDFIDCNNLNVGLYFLEVRKESESYKFKIFVTQE